MKIWKGNSCSTDQDCFQQDLPIHIGFVKCYPNRGCDCRAELGYTGNECDVETERVAAGNHIALALVIGSFLLVFYLCYCSLPNLKKGYLKLFLKEKSLLTLDYRGLSFYVGMFAQYAIAPILLVAILSFTSQRVSAKTMFVTLEGLLTTYFVLSWISIVAFLFCFYRILRAIRGHALGRKIPAYVKVVSFILAPTVMTCVFYLINGQTWVIYALFILLNSVTLLIYNVILISLKKVENRSIRKLLDRTMKSVISRPDRAESLETDPELKVHIQKRADAQLQKANMFMKKRAETAESVSFNEGGGGGWQDRARSESRGSALDRNRTDTLVDAITSIHFEDGAENEEDKDEVEFSRFIAELDKDIAKNEEESRVRFLNFTRRSKNVMMRLNLSQVCNLAFTICLLLLNISSTSELRFTVSVSVTQLFLTGVFVSIYLQVFFVLRFIIQTMKRARKLDKEEEKTAMYHKSIKTQIRSRGTTLTANEEGKVTAPWYHPNPRGSGI